MKKINELNEEIVTIGEYEFIKMPMIDSFGAIIVDEETGKIVQRGTDEFFGCQLNAMTLAKILIAKTKNQKKEKGKAKKKIVDQADLAAAVQRPWNENKVHTIAETIAGSRTIYGKIVDDEWVIQNLPMVVYTNVKHNDLIVEMCGTQYFLIPYNNAAIERYAQFVEFFDGQHRILSFADGFRELPDNVIGYNIFSFVYDNASDARTGELFHNLNFCSTKCSADLSFWNRMESGETFVSEAMLYDALKILSTKEEIVDGHGIVRSPLFGRIKFSQGSGVSAATVCEYTCTKVNEKERTELKDNLVSVLKAFKGAKKEITKEEIADALQTYLVAFEKVQVNDFGTNGRLFEKMATTRAAVALYFAIPCAKILHSKQMEWTTDDIAGVLGLLFHDIAHMESDFNSYKSDGRGSTYKRAVKDGDALIELCNNMCRDDIVSRYSVTKNVGKAA